ncbi:MAG: Gfo/Idh/MocA family oxidoreductase [Eubacteriales bacterium]
MAQYSYAIIGASRISEQHIEAAKMAGITLKAICDLTPENIQRVLEGSSLSDTERQNVAVCDDYHHLLDNTDVDFITIATDSGSHARIALDCIAAGFHVLIEKPIALSLKDADAVIEAAEKKNVMVAVSLQNRFNPAVKQLKQAIDAGDFGQLLHGCAHIRWNRNEDYFKSASWRGTWSADGGTLFNQCIHNIDILRWVMGGEIDEVFAYTDRLAHPYIETDDMGLGLLKMKNGAYGFIEGTINVYPKNLEETLYVFGLTGTAKLTGPSVSKIVEWNVKDANSEETVKAYEKLALPAKGEKHRPVYENFAAALAGQEPIYVDAKAGRDAIEVIFAMLLSSKQKKPVKLPISDLATTDFAGMYDE